MARRVHTDPDFSAVTSPPVLDILGRRLQPFTLGHIWALQATENAVFTAEEIRQDEIVTALHILGLPDMSAIRDFLRDPTPECMDWLPEVDPKDPTQDEEFIQNALDQYITKSMRRPRPNRSEGEDSGVEVQGKSKCPWIWHWVHDLIHCGVVSCAEDAWNMTFSEAAAHITTWMERQGNTDYNPFLKMAEMNGDLD